MKPLNGAVALLLALATAALGGFYLGSQDEHRQLLAQHFWLLLGLRLVVAGSAGLLAAGVWWSINWLLRKASWLPDIDLRRTARLLAAGVAAGSVAGAVRCSACPSQRAGEKSGQRTAPAGRPFGGSWL